VAAGASVPAARAARTSSISAAKVASSGIACPSQRRICSLTRGSAAASSVSTKALRQQPRRSGRGK